MLSHLVTFQSHGGNNYTIEICYNKNSGTCHSRVSAKRWRIDSENVNYDGLGGRVHFWIGFEVFENYYSETRERTEWKWGGWLDKVLHKLSKSWGFLI